ncbi:MAG TPA: phosphatidylglycerol lysyltransferase domain-containing protein [Geomonas sp.]|nr:phosphatidylglycerol lysyltransferase domain-containing protein [Geomonas sp.]
MDIPHYPQSRPIQLDDKPLLDAFFEQIQPRISELTFANLYLFRKVHDYRLTMVGDAVVALAKGYDGSAYFLPPLSGDRPGVARQLIGQGLTLYADDLFLQSLPGSEGLEAVADRDNFDYLHLKEEMATLSGRDYHRKKNRVNYFTVRHRYEVEVFEPRHLEGALALLEEWRRVKMAMGPKSVEGEVAGASEALRLHRELGLSGVVVLVEGVVKGFALGECLNRETAVCHFEKGDIFLEGLYQLLDREFSRLLFTGCRYLNREQDLGVDSLRQAKLSYRPVELIKKYRVRRASA